MAIPLPDDLKKRATAQQDAGTVNVPSLAGARVGPEDPVLVAQARAASIPEKERCLECGGTGYGTSTLLALKTCQACGGSGKKKAA